MTNNQKTLDIIIEKINEKHKYDLAKIDFVRSIYPDAKATITTNTLAKNNISFLSREVNANYKSFEFQDTWSSLLIKVFNEIEFSYNGKKETVRINSLPLTNKICYTTTHYTYDLSKTPPSACFVKTLSFCKFPINMKHNNFDDKLLNECRIACMNFIAHHPGYKIDDKLLDPRVKSLLLLM